MVKRNFRGNEVEESDREEKKEDRESACEIENIREIKSYLDSKR